MIVESQNCAGGSLSHSICSKVFLYWKSMLCLLQSSPKALKITVTNQNKKLAHDCWESLNFVKGGTLETWHHLSTLKQKNTNLGNYNYSPGSPKLTVYKKMCSDFLRHSLKSDCCKGGENQNENHCHRFSVKQMKIHREIFPQTVIGNIFYIYFQKFHETLISVDLFLRKES
jgi:hypothetical protein